MSLFQHCDVEGCDGVAEVPPGMNMIPDGWFLLVGTQRYQREPRVLESTMEIEGRMLTAKLPQPPEEAVEQVNVVICDRHKLPWRVRVSRRD